MRPRAKPFRRKVARPHAVTVKKHDGAYLAQCSYGETIGRCVYREEGRRMGREHLRAVAPHLAGARA